MNDNDSTQTVSKADQKVINVASHQARLAQAKAEGTARRAEKRDAGLKKQREFLDGVMAAAAQRKQERVDAHNARIEASKKPAKAA